MKISPQIFVNFFSPSLPTPQKKVLHRELRNRDILDISHFKIHARLGKKAVIIKVHVEKK